MDKKLLEFGNIYIKRIHLNKNDDFSFLTKRSINGIQYILANIQQPTIKINTTNDNSNENIDNVNVIDHECIHLLSNNSIGSIFLNTHNNENYMLKDNILKNVYRILKINGLLFYESKSIENIQYIENIGLKNIQYIQIQNKNLETENIKSIFIKLQ